MKLSTLITLLIGMAIGAITALAFHEATDVCSKSHTESILYVEPVDEMEEETPQYIHIESSNGDISKYEYEQGEITLVSQFNINEER